MILFSEKVKPTFTSSNLNILIVEDFQEVFFDVFEFEINGKKFVAEKVSSHKEAPVVNIPLVLEGKKFVAPFVLQTGKFEILFNKNNSTFVEDVNDEEHEVIVEYHDTDSEIEELVFERKESILNEIAQARQSAQKYVEEIKQQKISEAEQHLIERKRAVDREINESKNKLLEEFLGIVNNVKSEVVTLGEKEREDLTAFITTSITNLSEELIDTISTKQTEAEEKFNNSINELATKILSEVLLQEINANNKKTDSNIDKKFNLLSSNLNKTVKEHESKVNTIVDSKIQSLNESIVSLEKINIELNNQINKGDNRALSRIGNVKSQLEEALLDKTALLSEEIAKVKENVTSLYNEKISLLENRLDGDINITLDRIRLAIDKLKTRVSTQNKTVTAIEEKTLTNLANTKNELEDAISNSATFLIKKIDETEDKIKSFYDEKISLIEERTESLSQDSKQYVLSLVDESKQALLQEISKIKVEVPNIIIEKSNGKKEVDLKGIKTELEKIIGTRFSNELQALKRLIEMSSGGGSVAKQFAAGGTMDGTLNVTGNYLSGGVDLFDIFSGSGDDTYVNTLVRSNSANWDNAYNTSTLVRSNSANWDNAYNTSTVYQSNSTLYSTIEFTNTKFLPLSGGVITNSLTAQDVYVNSLSATTIHALSTFVNVIDIKQYELSGFRVTGNATVSGNISATGSLTSNNNISGFGTDNLLVNEAGFSPHSILTQQQLMLGGHKFRQLVNINQKTVGVNANTTAGAFQVLGMKTSIGAGVNQSAATFTLDGLFCSDTSTANLPINNEIDMYFHGTALQFQEDVNWVARINIGVPFARTVPFAGVVPATGTDKQWGIEFYWDSIETKFMGRLYYYFDASINAFGTPFILPIYKSSLTTGWQGFVYSIRLRQVPLGNSKLLLEFYINDSTSNVGGEPLSKNTPTATLETISIIPLSNYRFNGKHINFEVASSTTTPPTGVIRLQSTNMFCQFK